jgi:hypothetical protein
MIEATAGKLHWNYFLALEHDLEGVSRYIEFCKPNFNVYSIELAHLLFAAASEVDVIAKLLCKRLQPDSKCENIKHYCAILTVKLPALVSSKIFVPRYGLTLTPWDNWSGNTHPDWWDSYNHVKHQRDIHFGEATLKNALNALGGLLLLTYYHYSFLLSPDPNTPLSAKDTTQKLDPDSKLLRLPDDHYYANLIVSC